MGAARRHARAHAHFSSRPVARRLGAGSKDLWPSAAALSKLVFTVVADRRSRGVRGDKACRRGTDRRFRASDDRARGRDRSPLSVDRRFESRARTLPVWRNSILVRLAVSRLSRGDARRGARRRVRRQGVCESDPVSRQHSSEAIVRRIILEGMEALFGFGGTLDSSRIDRAARWVATAHSRRHVRPLAAMVIRLGDRLQRHPGSREFRRVSRWARRQANAHWTS